MVWDGLEKRKLARVSIPCRIIVYVPKEDAIDATINNISEGGVGFTLMRELEVSSIVGLEIYEIRNDPIICEGIVRWVNSIESARLRGRFFFNTGVQFFRIKSEDSLAIKNLVASKISASE